MVTVAGPVVQEWDARRLVRIGGPMPHTKDVRSVAYVSGESRLFTITEGDRGRFWDTPLAPAADASLLADVAEVVGGYGVNDLGALQPLPKAADHIGRLRWDLGSPAPGDSVGRIVARWLLSDPTRRTFAPLARAGADGRGVTWGENGADAIVEPETPARNRRAPREGRPAPRRSARAIVREQVRDHERPALRVGDGAVEQRAVGRHRPCHPLERVDPARRAERGLARIEVDGPREVAAMEVLARLVPQARRCSEPATDSKLS